MERTTRAEPDNSYWMGVAESIGRMDGKIDQVLASQAILLTRLDDHETRIRHMENGKWRSIGIAGGLGAVIGTMFPFLIPFLVKHGVIPT